MKGEKSAFNFLRDEDLKNLSAFLKESIYRQENISMTQTLPRKRMR
jgi:hypothetical protein